MTELHFDGEVVLVTGAGRGVGREHALSLASRGAKVVVADLGTELDGSGRSSGPADEVVKEIRDAGGEAVACGESVADPAGAKAMVELALDSFGRLDAVINNAGIHFPEMFEDYQLDDFRRMMEVHFFGTLSVCQNAWNHFLKSGGGRIVNTVSEGLVGLSPTSTAYGSAKGAITGLTLCLAAEGPLHNIRVNGFSPRVRTRLSSPEIMEKAFGRPAASFKSMDGVYPPDLSSFAAVYLVHSSCELNGVLLSSGGNTALRWAVMEGGHAEARSVEEVAANIGAIMAMPDMKHMGVGISGKAPHVGALHEQKALRAQAAARD
jgi:NAD(P)-dependent dehydrogenase (short-subunit alcohol dehydrogenase family)